MTIYSNAKIAGSINITGTYGNTRKANNVNGAAVVGHDDGVWTAIQGTGLEMKLLVRNPASEAYNAGPPVNGLQEITVTLPNNVIVPLETWGCSVDTNLFR